MKNLTDRVTRKDEIIAVWSVRRKVVYLEIPARLNALRAFPPVVRFVVRLAQTTSHPPQPW
jgi:hypothetical protein